MQKSAIVARSSDIP